jgi:hypothetical protein
VESRCEETDRTGRETLSMTFLLYHEYWLAEVTSTLRLRNIRDKIGGKSEKEERIHAKASDNSHAQ